MASQLQSLDDILTYILSTPPPSTLSDKLAAVAKKEYGEAVFASVLHGGQDPLAALDPARNTVGYLYILSARVNQPIGVPQALLANFCRSFDPAEAQLAADRMHFLAKGLARQDNLQLALPFLLDLTLRYASPGMLTTLHSVFLHACVATRSFALALPVLSIPITEVSTKISPLTYNDNLLYHYAGGMALTALKRFAEAAEFFEIAASAPVHSTPSAIQFEALKKLTIVQLLLHGTTKPLPKYAHSALGRLLKNSPYHAFVKVYPDNVTQMLQVVDKEQKMFAHDGNIGLLHQAIAKAPRWSIRKLTKTYLTLSLAEMGRAVGVHGEGEVRGMVISMIEQGEIHATVSAEGTVTFLDPAPEFNAKQVEEILRNAQIQGAVLKSIDNDVGRSREFLTKALKERDSGGGGGPGWADAEDLYASQSMWDDNF